MTTMEATAAPTGARLREEDLAVGKKWVHPDTQLEYDDFHAFFCGEAPLDHWRNDRIQELLRQKSSWNPQLRVDREPWEAFFERRVYYFRTCFNRDGDPYAARPAAAAIRPGFGSAASW